MFQTFPAEPVFFFLQRLFLDLQLHDTPPQFIQLRGHGIQLRLNQRAGLIHQVNGLIRKETVRNVTVGQSCRRYKGAVRNLNAMENFIPLLQSTKNGNRILHCRLIYHYRLEPPFQSRVFLNILPVLIQCGCADAMQLASGKHRLKHITGVHCTVCFTCSHNCVQLINEQDNLAVTVLHFLKNRFQTLLELSAVFRSCHKSAHVKRKDCLFLQSFRDIPADNPLGKPFYNCGFTDARFSDQHRIILCLTGQNPDHIADLFISSDYRIQLLLSCSLHKILSVFVQRIIGCFRIIACNPLVASHSGKRV